MRAVLAASEPAIAARWNAGWRWNATACTVRANEVPSSATRMSANVASLRSSPAEGGRRRSYARAGVPVAGDRAATVRDALGGRQPLPCDAASPGMWRAADAPPPLPPEPNPAPDGATDRVVLFSRAPDHPSPFSRTEVSHARSAQCPLGPSHRAPLHTAQAGR